MYLCREDDIPKLTGMKREEGLQLLKNIQGRFGEDAADVVALITDENARIIKIAKRDKVLNSRLLEAIQDSGLPATQIDDQVTKLGIPEYDII